MARVGEEKLKVSMTLPISSYIGRDERSEGWALFRPAQLAAVFKDKVAHRILTDIRKGWRPFLVWYLYVVGLVWCAVFGLPEVGTFSILFPELKVRVQWNSVIQE